MKKIFLFLISVILFIGISGFTNAIFNDINNDLTISIKEETLKFTVDFPDLHNLNIVNEEKGQRLELEGFSYLLVPGKPMLPVKNYMFALPPGTKAKSVDYKVEKAILMQDSYDIVLVEPIIVLDDSNYYEYESIMIEWKWNNNYQSTYSSNQAYPEEVCRVIGFGTFRKYSYVSISICPFKYHPKSQQLYYYDSIDVIVNYEVSNSVDIETITIDNVADYKASNLFFNYDEIKDLYQPLGILISVQKNSYDYIIITNDELKDIVTTSDFLKWKSSLGYDIRFVTVTDPLITDQPGIDLAEQIRNFLREYYISWGIKYVLIVGDYTTVPMRYCSPDSNWLAGTVPTDTYYADLSYPDSESWDSNNDGYYGVYTQDNPDFVPEVYVGRIPTRDITRLTYTLDKMTSFERDTGDWKNNALMGGAMLFYANENHNEDIDFDIDGARLVDFIEKDLMNDWTISHYSEYEGLSPSVFPFDPLTEQAFTADWRSGEYAVVNWAAHGAPASIGRVIWNWDDGDGVPESENEELGWGSFLSTYSNLEGDYPSIVFAVSCNVGYPEPTPDGNLGIDMLTKESFGAAVAVCSSTRGAAVSADWVTSHSGAEALCYEFNRYMIDGPNGPSKLGEALYDSKSYVHYNFGWAHHYEFMNMYDYNLYGDPSMMREGISSNAPSAPQINGPTSGNIGEEYEYTFISVDPAEDALFYLIEWGDGETEEWIGPFNSGEQITLSHSWSKSKTFNIRAKAKDEGGEESGWTILEVSMPKNRVLLKSFFFRFLKNFIFYI
jgi:hypothetical protein